MVVGYSSDYVMLVLFGAFMIGFSILLFIGYRVIEASSDDDWVIKASPSEAPSSDPYLSFIANPQDGPGSCPSCGGALFYGRLHCPHCSESIFQGTGEVGQPPEL
jgi:hypothetical protein